MTVLARDGQSEKARARRRMYPLHAYLGRNGSGKSLAMVYDTLPDLADGLPVLSTVRLLDNANPRECEGWRSLWVDGGMHESPCYHPKHGQPGHLQAHPLWSEFSRWDQLLSWRDGPVLMDEITGVADSADNALPGPVADFLHQMRRADVAVRITGISWIRINKRLREVVNAVTRCRSSFPVTMNDPDGRARLWRPRRLAKWTTYDAQTLPTDDHTEHAYDNADQLVKGRHWIPTSPALAAYDTFDSVYRVGDVTDAGRCVTCSGVRRVPECACADYVSDRAGRSAARKGRSPEDGRATRPMGTSGSPPVMPRPGRHAEPDGAPRPPVLITADLGS